MEKDNEVSGDGNSNTSEYWQYDGRLGRRWNVDSKPNPSISQYACFANNPIIFADPKGDTLFVREGNATQLIQAQNDLLGMVSAANQAAAAFVTNPLGTADPNFNLFVQVTPPPGYVPGTDAGLDLLIGMADLNPLNNPPDLLYEVTDNPQAGNGANNGTVGSPYSNESSATMNGVQYKVNYPSFLNIKTGISEPSSDFENNGYLPVAKYLGISPTTCRPVSSTFTLQLSVHSNTTFYSNMKDRNGARTPYNQNNMNALPRSLGVFVSLQGAWFNLNDMDLANKKINTHMIQVRAMVNTAAYQGASSAQPVGKRPTPSASGF